MLWLPLILSPSPISGLFPSSEHLSSWGFNSTQRMQNLKLWAWQLEISPQKCISFTSEDRTIIACVVLWPTTVKSCSSNFTSAPSKLVEQTSLLFGACLLRNASWRWQSQHWCSLPWVHFMQWKGTVPDSFWTQCNRFYHKVPLWLVSTYPKQGTFLHLSCSDCGLSCPTSACRVQSSGPRFGKPLHLLSWQAPRVVFRLWWKM